MRTVYSLFVCSSILQMLISSQAWADVRLPKVFGDHMVLQQKTEAPCGAGPMPMRK